MTHSDLIETKKVLTAYGESTVSSMRNILISKGKSASGQLVRSISYRLTYLGEDLALEFDMLDYGIFVDQGRKPGKMPPISSIRPWLSIKGIDQKFAFPIAKKIGKKGIPATPFFGSTITSTQEILAEELADAFALDIVNYVTNTLDK